MYMYITRLCTHATLRIAVPTSTSEAAKRQDAALGDDVVFYLRSVIGPETVSAPPPRRSLAEVFKVRAARQTRLPARPRSCPGGDLDLMGQWLHWIVYSQI